jgi:F0F1-type ATP synthase delta subunit
LSREQYQSTIDHYEAMLEDFSQVYERSELSKQLSSVQETEHKARLRHEEAQEQAAQITQKIRALEERGLILCLLY